MVRFGGCILLAAACVQGSSAAYSVYTASLSQLGSSGVTGEVTIFVTGNDMLGVGSATALDFNLLANSSGGSNCTAKNGCGAHVHSGTACDDAASQGGHYFAAGGSDPWAPIGYGKTSSTGAATFSFAVRGSLTSIENKPFVVHNNAGGRVACGLLSKVAAPSVKSAYLAPLSGSGVTGEVAVYTTVGKVIVAGHSNGLEPNLKDSTSGGSSCTAKNGCGAHVHSGTSCDTAVTQGGHYYKGNSDPWATVRYSSTTSLGHGDFIFSVADSATDVTLKPFIVHNNAGGRVACGILCDDGMCPQNVGAKAKVFAASLTPLGSSGVTGEVSIFVGSAGLLGVGSATGLEGSLLASASGGKNCTAKNACGAHVHSGTACTDASTQGGHFTAAGETDGWATIGYHGTTAAGAATFSFSLTTPATTIANKPFVVHNNAGSRVACGLLSEVAGTTLTSAKLTALSDSGAVGEVKVYTTAEKVIVAGHTNGLEASLKDSSHSGTSCTAKNGCGAHVHSGSACSTSALQGGHYYKGTSDPWSTKRYTSTSSAGHADFIFSVTDNATDVMSKPFIVHNNAGARVACGILSKDTGSGNTTGSNEGVCFMWTQHGVDVVTKQNKTVEYEQPQVNGKVTPKVEKQFRSSKYLETAIKAKMITSFSCRAQGSVVSRASSLHTVWVSLAAAALALVL